ncbi:MAG: bifunctional tetrahydrofolate synthase/dihydrofolate synthase [Methylohalobius sp.]|nr:bifunctional tetrahydrofolate synthase/dihydrofolate synthase [Methylohalobius sp.]
MRFTQLADWLAWQQSFHPRWIDLGLERVKHVFQALCPDYQQPLTLTVGGTNGKGSCVAMLEAILRAQGLRVGAYTSPHLLRYNERIRIDGVAVEDEAIVGAFARIDAARGETSLSFFEFATLAALELFAQAKVEVQVLEVGMGGRLDAVNLIAADVALIASIDLDHQQWLGETREQIGWEKAGIFRPGRPAVVGDRDVPQSVLAWAEHLKTPLWCLGRQFDWQLLASGWDWLGPDEVIASLPFPALPGRQQLDNAATVLAALSRIRDRLPISRQAICQGLQSVHLPGRYQLLPGSPPVLLDVAHNPQAAGRLAEYLQSAYPRRRILALFAAMSDKDIEGIVRRMGPVVSVWALAPLPDNPRAASEERIKQAFQVAGFSPPLAGFESCIGAFKALRQQARPDDLIVVFGSFYLLAAFLAAGDGEWKPA